MVREMMYAVVMLKTGKSIDVWFDEQGYNFYDLRTLKAYITQKFGDTIEWYEVWKRVAKYKMGE